MQTMFFAVFNILINVDFLYIFIKMWIQVTDASNWYIYFKFIN